ncbi:MAG: hypothetical protein ACF8PN_09425 [Phycisphaerales bacterium]
MTRRETHNPGSFFGVARTLALVALCANAIVASVGGALCYRVTLASIGAFAGDCVPVCCDDEPVDAAALAYDDDHDEDDDENRPLVLDLLALLPVDDLGGDGDDCCWSRSAAESTTTALTLDRSGAAADDASITLAPAPIGAASIASLALSRAAIRAGQSAQPPPDFVASRRSTILLV